MNAMFDSFSHFLSYGATDQQTIRALSSQYQGIVVPGTIAAFQAEGTRGFVLSLSAADRVPYTIDPRTPLFQSRVESPKKSHLALARILGVDTIFEREQSVPLSAWVDPLIQQVAENWIEFNTGYLAVQPKAFEKYARRLGKPVSVERAQGPEWILAPYLTRSSSEVALSEISKKLWESSKIAAGARGVADQLRPVIAVDDASLLNDEVASCDTEEVVVWVSNLDELALQNAAALTEYARAIKSISSRGQAPFALYGGYFSVLLGTVGLRGASHGVGFSEHRNHVELKTSGAAPARFYVERMHRYVPVDLASELWRRSRSLVASFYAGYRDVDPQEMDYHELMLHSVRARAHEIQDIRGTSAGDQGVSLRSLHSGLESEIASIRLTEGLRRRTEALLTHLPVWARVMNVVA